MQCTVCGADAATLGEAGCPTCLTAQREGGCTAVTLVTRTTEGLLRARTPLELDGAVTERYTLERRLGAGAMGMVWRAQERATGRIVAIKFLIPQAGDGVVLRFLKEVEILKGIEHPHVIRVLDAGASRDAPYMVLECVEGGSLRDRITDGERLPIAEAIRIACDCLEGLSACHAQGVVHRDFKPENVLLRTSGEAVVADLGIAKAYGSSSELTRTGTILGTPLYMAPEQIRGERVSVAADLYAVGAVLFEMLTGRPPFQARRLNELIGLLQTGTPPALRTLRPEVPEALEALVKSALSRHAADRPHTAPDFVTALKNLDRLPSPATSPAPAAPRASVSWRLALGALGALALVGGSIAFATRSRAPSTTAVWSTSDLPCRIGNHYRITLSPDGKLALLSTGCHSRLARVETGEVVAATAQVTSARLSPDGTRIAGTMHGREELAIFDASSARRLVSLDTAFDGYDFEWAHGGRMLLVAPVKNAGPAVFDAGTGRLVQRVGWGDNVSVAASQDGSTIAVLGFAGSDNVQQLRTFAMPALRPLAKMPGRDAMWWQSLSLAPHGDLLAFGGLEDLQIWNAHTGEPVDRIRILRDSGAAAPLDGPPEVIAASAFAPTGMRIAVASSAGRLDLWDKRGGSWQRELLSEGQLSCVTGPIELAWSGDGSRVAAVSPGLPVMVWDTTAAPAQRVSHDALLLDGTAPYAP